MAFLHNFWLVVGGFCGGCGWFWGIVDGSGWLWVVAHFSITLLNLSFKGIAPLLAKVVAQSIECIDLIS